MRVHFSTDNLPSRDREQFWLDFVAKQVMKITPVDRPDPATFRAQLEAHVAGRFTLSRYQTSHRSQRRTTADVSRDSSGRFHLRRVPREQFYIAAPTRSTVEEIRLGPCDLCVTSLGWPHQSSMQNGTSASGLLIPHEVLSPLLAGGRLTRPVAVRAGSPLGSLLGAAFDAAVTQVPLLSPELGDAVLQNLCGSTARSSANSACRQRLYAPQAQAGSGGSPSASSSSLILHGMRCRIALSETTDAPATVKRPMSTWAACAG